MIGAIVFLLTGAFLCLAAGVGLLWLNWPTRHKVYGKSATLGDPLPWWVEDDLERIRHEWGDPGTSNGPHRVYADGGLVDPALPRPYADHPDNTHTGDVSLGVPDWALQERIRRRLRAGDGA